MWAPLLGQAAVFAALVALSSCLTGSHLCPRSLDCARAGRHFCPPSSSHCGPCLRPLVENSHGRCVLKRRHAPHSAHFSKGKTNTYPELDEEIDFLSAVISEQRTESRLPASPSQYASNPKAKQLSELSYDQRPLITEPPASQSVQVTTLAPSTTTTTTNTTNTTPTLLRDPIILSYPSNDHVFIIMSSVFIVAGSLALIMAGACWVRLQKGLQLTQKMDSPVHRLIRAQAFDNLPGDKKLAHSAQMYHYQHQKQQMLSLEKNRDEPKVPDSGASTDEENEDGDFTVYECPGLAPTGEMEVKNPLFDDSPLYLQKFH
ncbi:neural proliferation differentiation and control protein 1 [Hippoglossus hippoglossus]|uniref:neural proliferation differentiation and control protein 1 n=1 Tax=Hippoglossus hippoglossus TaxID=8267 RepID=UPI00148D95E0|nr:neural proliferation differentiation and control protein 1 [Hippoglossus hippoglossus]